MKKTIILLFFIITLISCDYKEIEYKEMPYDEISFEGYLSAYEGYQLVKTQIESEKIYNFSEINLIGLRSFHGYVGTVGEQIIITSLPFIGENIGKSNFWVYFISCKGNNNNKYFRCICEIIDGNSKINIYPLNEEEIKLEFGELPKKFINLTRENDSPIFVSKLLGLTQKKYYVIAFNYLDDIRFQTDIPYWIYHSTYKGISDISNGDFILLLADENINNNAIIEVKD